MSRFHLSLAVLSCFALSAGVAMAQDNTKKIITSDPTPNIAPAIPRSVYAPLLRSAELPYAEIALNNRSPQPTEATLTFHSKDGQPWQAPAITVQPGEVKHIDLDEILPDQLKYQLELGGLFVQYTGQWNQVASQLTLITRDRKGSIDEVLRPDTDFRTGVQDAVWYIPSDGKAAIALGNTTNTDISATLMLPGGESRPVLLRPFETRLIVVNQNADPQGGATSRVASVHLQTSAPAGALRAIGYVTFGSGLARAIRFYERATVRQPHLFAANLPIQDSEIQMVLKNIGDQPLNATPRFLPVGSGPVSPVELPAVTLQAGEAKLVDCTVIQQLAASNSSLSRVSVQVRNSGEKGTLIGSLASLDLRAGISYEIPLRDSGSLRNSGGGYPIRLDGDYSTFVTLFNVTDEPVEFRAVIRHLSDDYVLRSRTLAPGESAIFDIRDLRDRKIPDPNGKTLPEDLVRAQFNWSMLQGGAVTRLIGRSEIVSPSRGVSSSYSCGVCCPDSGPTRLFAPWQLAIGVGGLQQFTTTEQFTNCYNQIWSEPTSFSFTSRNPSIADSLYVDYGVAEAHGYAPGGTMQSTGQYTYWHYWDDGNDCYYEPWPMESDQDVAVMQVSVTTADIISDQVSVTLSPTTASGTLTVTVQGSGTNQTIFTGTKTGGSYTFSFNRPSLPVGQFSTVNATWTVNGTNFAGSRPVSFNVLGDYLHTQYNSPAESSCTGSAASAYKTNNQCVFAGTTLKSDFISQSWLNGSGIAISFGPEQNESFCMAPTYNPPSDASGRSFRPVSQITAPGGPLNNTTVAKGDDAPLVYGDQVLIVGLGTSGGTVKTVTDRCPACAGQQHLDDYTTQASCAVGTIPSLGTFKTIRLR